MDDVSWEATNDLNEMLDAIQGKVSERKLRLFACACIRSLWVSIGQNMSPYTMVNDAESFADFSDQNQGRRMHSIRVALYHTMEVSRRYHDDAATLSRFRAEQSLFKKDAWEAAREVQRAVEIAVVAAARPEEAQEFDHIIRQDMANLLRDIIGNPYFPIYFLPNWQSTEAVALATTVYQGRTFDLLPQLGNIIENSGCSESTILNHCRSCGQHVRGCWIIDMVLNKQ